MATAHDRPSCPDCGNNLVCTGCDDTRPTAEDIDAGWRILSPFGRWETVTKARQEETYGPVLIWTEECGPGQPWRYPRWHRLQATRPETRLHGDPEIRVVEYDWRDGPMYALASQATHYGRYDIAGAAALAEARPAGKGRGWTVSHRPGGGEPIVISCESKAKARTELRRIARELAKVYRVKLTLPKPGGVL